MKTNQMIAEKLFTFNKQFYDLFILLVENNNSFNYELSQRLGILDEFFMVYKYPKLSDFAYNIENHEGEDGPFYAHLFLRNSYELFLKENDPEIYSLFRNAEDIWRDQNGIKEVLEGKNTEPEKCSDDNLPF
jgi:hypothetical protein